jgi:hypothetical protein
VAHWDHGDRPQWSRVKIHLGSVVLIVKHRVVVTVGVCDSTEATGCLSSALGAVAGSVAGCDADTGEIKGTGAAAAAGECAAASGAAAPAGVVALPGRQSLVRLFNVVRKRTCTRSQLITASTSSR